MLQHDSPDDYVIATEETHTIREMCEIAFRHVGLDFQDHVTSDPKMVRPAEVEHLIGDASKAREVLGWEPKVGFRDLIEMMVDADLDLIETESKLRNS
jgi:GDPmannose 4,6-dehydratase